MNFNGTELESNEIAKTTYFAFTGENRTENV